MKRILCQVLTAAVFFTGCAETALQTPVPSPEPETEIRWTEEAEESGIPSLEKPVIFARIRMIQHEEVIPGQQSTHFFASHFTVELIEYELSDTYKMML